MALQLCKEVSASNDESKTAEIEAFTRFIESEKSDLGKEAAALSEELSFDEDRILRVSADFDNFQRRTNGEWFSFVANACEEVLENLLPVLNDLERAKV